MAYIIYRDGKLAAGENIYRKGELGKEISAETYESLKIKMKNPKMNGGLKAIIFKNAWTKKKPLTKKEASCFLFPILHLKNNNIYPFVKRNDLRK